MRGREISNIRFLFWTVYRSRQTQQAEAKHECTCGRWQHLSSILSWLCSRCHCVLPNDTSPAVSVSWWTMSRLVKSLPWGVVGDSGTVIEAGGLVSLLAGVWSPSAQSRTTMTASRPSRGYASFPNASESLPEDPTRNPWQRNRYLGHHAQVKVNAPCPFHECRHEGNKFVQRVSSLFFS